MVNINILWNRLLGFVENLKNRFETGVVGIDLGTVNTLICIKNKGVVLNEPSVVAYIIENGMQIPYLFGKRAKIMFGKTPIKMDVVYPLEDGVISDFRMAEEMIKYFIKKTLGKYVIHRPIVIIGVPLNSTPVEKKSIQDSVHLAGARDVFLVHESMAAAIGAKLPIDQPHGSMVIDIGGGTTEVSLVSLGGIVKGKSVRIGGDKMDMAILNYVKNKYNLLIGESTAENIKCTIGSAYIKPSDTIREMSIRGRDLSTGTPREITIYENDVVEAIKDIINQIVITIVETLESAPPELASDIVDRGIVLCGGGALIKNLDYVIADKVNLAVFVPFNPELCTINGISKIIRNYKEYDYVLFREI